MFYCFNVHQDKFYQGICDYIGSVLRTTHTHVSYENEIHEVAAPGVLVEDALFATLQHRAFRGEL